ncbi:MAG: hypothetical protein HYX92_18425 [Chloroflexi bacterium]|nr:hypothetical protein [Chloroflexota bacterium]
MVQEKRDKTVCPHLGMAEAPLEYSVEPTDQHRCYLWMQRDRVHLDHQRMFCLGELHSQCPWLVISAPLHTPSQRALSAILAVALFIPATAWNHLDQLCRFVALRIWPSLVKALLRSITGLATFLLAGLGRARSGAATLAASILFGASPALASLLFLLWRLLKGMAELAWDFALKTGSLAALALLQAGRRVAPFLWRQVAFSAERLAKGLGAAMRCGLRTLDEWTDSKLKCQDVHTLIDLGKKASLRGDRRVARRYFSRAVALEAQNEEAWLWKAATTDSPGEAAFYLKKALAVNPHSGRAQAGLDTLGDTRENSPWAGPVAAEAASVPYVEPLGDESCLTALEGTLLQQGIVALNQGNEERARKFFVAATEAHPDSEEAWFWTAKTAPDLAELISCLERILVINPNNGRVKADLAWAMQRKRQEELLSKQDWTSDPARGAFVKDDRSRPRPASRAMLSIAGAASFTLGALWLGAGVLPLLPAALVLGDWWGIRILPVLDLPRFTISGPFADLNLFAAIPVLMGIIFLLVSDGLFSLQRASVYWLVIGVGAAIVATNLYSAPPEAKQTVLTLSGIAIVAASLGRRGVKPQATIAV